MKKTLSLILILILTLSLFSACGKNSEDASTSSETGEPAADSNLQTVMKIGNSSVSLQEYNYTLYSNYLEFCNTYSSYLSYFGLGDKNTLKSQKCSVSEDYETWADFFMAQTEEMLTQVYTFYNAAKATGMALNETYTKDLEAYMVDLSTVAEEAGKTPDEFMAENYGAGMTAELYRVFLTHRLLATQYCDEQLAKIQYSDAEYEAYYQENKLSFDKVSFRIFTVIEDYLPADTSKDDEETTLAAIKAYAELFAKDLTSEEMFAQRALAFVPEEEKANYQDDAATLANNIAASDLADGDMKTWLFDASRKKGDVAVHKTGESAYTVCYFLSSGRDEYPLVSMRHLLLNVSDKEGSTDAEVQAKIQQLYDDWKAKGEKEEDFIAMATEHTQDPGSQTNGGLYDLFSRGTMVAPIDNWLYEEGRKLGDSAIIKTTYGYHIVLFMGYGEIAWKDTCYQALQQGDYLELYEKLLPENKATFEENYKDAVANG